MAVEVVSEGVQKKERREQSRHLFYSILSCTDGKGGNLSTKRGVRRSGTILLYHQFESLSIFQL